MITTERRRAVITLPLASPVAELRRITGLSHRALGERRSPPVADATVVDAERSGSRIGLDTLAKYAAAAGYRLVVGVEPVDASSASVWEDFLEARARAMAWQKAQGSSTAELVRIYSVDPKQVEAILAHMERAK